LSIFVIVSYLGVIISLSKFVAARKVDFADLGDSPRFEKNDYWVRDHFLRRIAKRRGEDFHFRTAPSIGLHYRLTGVMTRPVNGIAGLF
jgi:hypothetical protein